ncbi:MAG: ATP-binding cassette domain-containing protein [Coriobacteriales bacterium]|nr:ATP-binding cassette domain-containing protein [Coriobacteriales bacterium]
MRLEVPGFALDVDWRVGNELAVLFGYSGSGKSLTLRALAGLVRPGFGRIEIAGETLYDSSRRIHVKPKRRKVGYVAQDPALFPHLSVVRNVEYGLHEHPRRERRERALETLEALGIANLAERRPGTLSGGQRQRVALARALAREPRALLLDEPFSAVDNPVRQEMREVVRDVRERFGVPVVLVTHDMYEAYTMADRMVVYSGTGEIQVGTPCEIFSRPKSPEIEALITAERLWVTG